uniref:Uncharacterized protein n=1 Tax=viral metagenome TaxID=1070528 RepID=A0A6M3XD81_9ZZZZ
MILSEVGAELELFLLDKENNILEPIKYGFPSDEMGFLIEIRGEHSDNYQDIVDSLETLMRINISKAERLGFIVGRESSLEVSKEFQDYISEKYRHAMLPDHTRNIYGSKESHHTGFSNNLATAGLHLHFSSRRIFSTKCLQRELPIEHIVGEMDNKYKEDILLSNRIPGEYELKPWGFEYRSLPASIDYKKAINVALNILKEVK